MEDCELFTVFSISSIICVYLVISNKCGVKRTRKEVIMI